MLAITTAEIYAPVVDFHPQPYTSMYPHAPQSFDPPLASSSSSTLPSLRTATGPAPAHLHSLGMTPSLPSIAHLQMQAHYPQVPSYPPHLPSPRVDQACYPPPSAPADVEWPPHSRLRSHDFTELPIQRPSPVLPQTQAQEGYQYRTGYPSRPERNRSSAQAYYEPDAGQCPPAMPSPPNTPRIYEAQVNQHNQGQYQSAHDEQERIPLAPIRGDYFQAQSVHYPRSVSYDPSYHSAPPLAHPTSFDSAGRFFRRTSDPEQTQPYQSYNHQTIYEDDYAPMRTMRSALVSPKGGQSKIRFDGPPASRGRTVSATSSASFFSDEDKHETVTPFISKLNHLLSLPEYSSFIRWNAAGTCFLFAPQSDSLLAAFARFFRHSNIHSFVRQLNIYGFSRLSMLDLLTAIEGTHPPGEPLVTSDYAGFGHPGFWRGEGCDLTRVKPKVVQKKKSRRAARGELAPAMPVGVGRSVRGIREEVHVGVGGRRPY